MFGSVRVQSHHLLQQRGVRLVEVRPGHHQRRPELAARDVKQAAGGAVTLGTKTGIVRILLWSSEHILWGDKSEINK